MVQPRLSLVLLLGSVEPGNLSLVLICLGLIILSGLVTSSLFLCESLLKCSLLVSNGFLSCSLQVSNDFVRCSLLVRKDFISCSFLDSALVRSDLIEVCLGEDLWILRVDGLELEEVDFGGLRTLLHSVLDLV